MKRLELAIESIILASRWLLVVFYLGLGIALFVYAISFAKKLFEFGATVFILNDTDTILKILGLIDAALVASLVVMVIIGLLAAYVGPKYFSQVGKSEVKMAQAQIDSLEKALHQYRLDVGTYPTTEQGLDALRDKPTREPVPANWKGPYLRKPVPLDPLDPLDISARGHALQREASAGGRV